jgi:hypothetical protein
MQGTAAVSGFRPVYDVQHVMRRVDSDTAGILEIVGDDGNRFIGAYLADRRRVAFCIERAV